MTQPAEVHIRVPSLTVKVERTVPEIEPPPAMEFDELQPWLSDHPDLRQIALQLIREVTDETEVEVEEGETPTEASDAEMVDEAEPIDAPVEGEAAEDEPALTLVPPPELREDPGRRTLTLHRTLRSGAVVRFDGDIVLFGDLNPGAQVIAAGNIIVLGNLKGLAHAGATGDEDAFILGFDLQPTQLRIARHIAIPPPRDVVQLGLQPELARIRHGSIAIEPYRARSPRSGV